jgi:hypothetical protein
MSLPIRRLLAVVAGSALAVWWGRAVAHGKKPPPEGRWREISDESLSSSDPHQ